MAQHGMAQHDSRAEALAVGISRQSSIKPIALACFSTVFSDALTDANVDKPKIHPDITQVSNQFSNQISNQNSAFRR
jgi:hypothetical protein